MLLVFLLIILVFQECTSAFSENQHMIFWIRVRKFLYFREIATAFPVERPMLVSRNP